MWLVTNSYYFTIILFSNKGMNLHQMPQPYLLECKISDPEAPVAISFFWLFQKCFFKICDLNLSFNSCSGMSSSSSSFPTQDSDPRSYCQVFPFIVRQVLEKSGRSASCFFILNKYVIIHSARVQSLSRHSFGGSQSFGCFNLSSTKMNDTVSIFEPCWPESGLMVSWRTSSYVNMDGERCQPWQWHWQADHTV